MSKTSGYSSYACDRCGAQEYIQDSNDSRKSTWGDIVRITSDNVETKRVLCASCHKTYKTLAAKQDTEFNTFMAEGAAE